MRSTALLALIGFSLLAAIGHADERLRIATDATFPPFHFIDDDGQVDGFDVALARAVAEHAGFDVEVVVLDYDELFAGLSAGRHDLVAATTGITEERQKEYLFSAPYYETCQAAVVRNNAAGPRAVVDLEDRRIGAAGSGTSASAMYQTLAAEHVRIDDGQGPTLLAAHEIDAWIVDEFVAVRAARESFGQFRVLPDPVAAEHYGLVIAWGRDTLKARLDQSLEALQLDGTVEKLQKQYGVDRDSEWPVEW